MKMGLITFLADALKVFGLIFLLGVLFNLILDIVIIQPIQRRRIADQKLKLFEAVIEKIEKGEEIPTIDVEKMEKEIEK